MHGTLSAVRGVVLSVCVALFGLALPRVAAAQAERIPFLTEKLRDPDFRVRTNAALALGATNSEAAVEPLCSGLADATDVVRQASGAGLQRLNRKKALPCLTERIQAEGNAAVRAQLERARAAIESGGIGESSAAPAAPASDPNKPHENADAKYYVQLAAVTNRTDRPAGEIDALVRAAVVQKLDSLGVFQLAPAKESIASAKSAMAKRKIKNGFYLSVSVDPVSHASGVRAQVRVAVFTYPSKNLRAEIPASSSSSSSSADHHAEDQVLSRATESAISTFAQNVEQLL